MYIGWSISMFFLQLVLMNSYFPVCINERTPNHSFVILILCIPFEFVLVVLSLFVIQFYPWFNCYFLLFYIDYHTLISIEKNNEK